MKFTFLEAVNSFSTVRRLVFAFDFLDALIGFFGFEFGVSIAVGEVGGFASWIGFLCCCVGVAVVFHLLNLTNNYIIQPILSFNRKKPIHHLLDTSLVY